MKKNKGIIIAISVALFLVLAAGLVAAFTLFGNTKVRNINGLYKALARTSLKYTQETTALKQTNQVLFNLNKALTEGASQTLSMDNLFTVDIIDSKQDKRFDLYVDAPYYLDGRAEFYLQDEEILFGFEGSEYLASTSSTFDDDLISLMEEAGDQDLVEQLRDFFEDLDLSYDGLTSTEEFEKEYAALTMRCTKVLQELLSYGTFSTSDETISYDDNGTNVNRKVQNVSLEFTNSDVADWIEEDLLPTLEDDEFLKDMFTGFQTGYSATSYSTPVEYQEILRDLKDGAAALRDRDDSEYTLTFTVYKGHVIETILDMEIVDDASVDKMTLSFATQGEKNLLDDISISIIDVDGDETIFAAKGNHIDGPTFHTDFYFEDYTDELSFTFDWKTDEKSDNLVISGVDSYGDDFDFTMTFATKDKGIFAELDIEGSTFEYTVAALEQLSPLPTNTVPLDSVDLLGIYNMYSDIFDTFLGASYDDYDYDDYDYDDSDYDFGDMEGWEEWTDEEWEEWFSNNSDYLE